jgi:hypothetical protein
LDEIDILGELVRDNPSVSRIILRIYLDALQGYLEAAENVEKNGRVCFHPRTGSPIENPYLRILNEQGKVLRGMQLISGDRVLTLILDRNRREGDA